VFVFWYRVHVGRARPERTPGASRKSALQRSIRGYAEKLGDEVIDLCMGMAFDSLGEAFTILTTYTLSEDKIYAENCVRMLGEFWGHGFCTKKVVLVRKPHEIYVD
jgi:hypothetical protein